jgi:hypothetical protein
MHEQFKSVYGRILEKLKVYLKSDDVHYRRNYLPFFRIFTGEEAADPVVKQVMSELRPPAHYDSLWHNLKWPKGTSFKNTISYTLTLALPGGGHGLQASSAGTKKKTILLHSRILTAPPRCPGGTPR